MAAVREIVIIRQKRAKSAQKPWGRFLCTVGWAGESDRQRIAVCNSDFLVFCLMVRMGELHLSYGAHDDDHQEALG